jgi:hypothetical protein
VNWTKFIRSIAVYSGAIAPGFQFFNVAVVFFKYATVMDKFDRHGYKQRTRMCIVTNEYFYGLDAITLKLRDKIKISLIEGI